MAENTVNAGDCFPTYYCHANGSEEIRLGTAIAAIFSNKKILLELRSDVTLWGLFGGRLDVGETPQECACREFFEETGISISADRLSLYGVYGDPKDGRIVQYPERRIQLVDIVYLTRLDDDISLSLSEESIDVASFAYEDLPQELVAPSARILKDLRASNHL